MDLSTFPLTPTMLSMIIIFVFSSLLALIYLTLKSYQALSNFQFEEELINESFAKQNSVEQGLDEGSNTDNGGVQQQQQTGLVCGDLQPEPMLREESTTETTSSTTDNMRPTITTTTTATTAPNETSQGIVEPTGCSCHFVNNLSESYRTTHPDDLNPVVNGDGDVCFSGGAVGATNDGNRSVLKKSSFHINERRNINQTLTLYNAHIHDHTIEAHHHICHSVTSSLIPEIASAEQSKSDCTFFGINQKNYQQFLPGCCQSTPPPPPLFPMVSSYQSNQQQNKVNMIENPMNS